MSGRSRWSGADHVGGDEDSDDEDVDGDDSDVDYEDKGGTP